MGHVSAVRSVTLVKRRLSMKKERADRKVNVTLRLYLLKIGTSDSLPIEVAGISESCSRLRDWQRGRETVSKVCSKAS